MAEVALGIDLEKYGSLIAKTPADNLTIRFDWDHVGAAVTFDAWVAIGHKGFAVDSFGKLFAVDGPEIKITGLSCPQDITKKGYYHQLTRLLSAHYGVGETITDGAIRVVFKIPGQADKAGYLWNAFKITPPEEYTLSVSVAAPAVGYVTKSPDKATYTAGESVTLTAYLESWAIGSYVFDHWVINGVTRTYNPITIIMDSNKTVTDYFKEVAVERYTLTLKVSPSGAGYVTGAGTYNAGAWATIKATPYSGYEFDHWGGDYYGTDNPAQIVMAFDKTVTAYFKPTVPPEQYSLICLTSPAFTGWVAKDPDKTWYDYGEVVTCTAHPYSGHTFRFWDCDGEWISGAASFNFMVLADHTLTAHFTE